MHNIHVWGPRDRAILPPDAFKINTTSTSTDFCQALSPFMNQGPIELAGLTSHNVENFWAASKVFPGYENEPAKWKQWRDDLLGSPRALRYPCGKGATALFAHLPGKGKLGYVEARKEIFLSVYRQKLDRYCQRQINSLLDILTLTDIWLFDFDVYISDDTYEAKLNDPGRPFGHGFIVKQYLEERLRD